jgi:hypothetical protein
MLPNHAEDAQQRYHDMIEEQELHNYEEGDWNGRFEAMISETLQQVVNLAPELEQRAE